ncbi:hypothetical protein [Rhizobium yanglingense]
MARHIAVPFEDVPADAKELTGDYAGRLKSLILLFASALWRTVKKNPGAASLRYL